MGTRAMGTRVECSSRFVLQAKMEGADTDAAPEGFAKRLRTLPKSALQTLTHDPGKERARHEELERKAGIRIYFADPHRPWQRPTNEYTNPGCCTSNLKPPNFDCELELDQGMRRNDAFCLVIGGW